LTEAKRYGKLSKLLLRTDRQRNRKWTLKT